jgi:hypothetical protein
LPTLNPTLPEDGMKESSRKVFIGKPQRIFISSIVWKRGIIKKRKR